jgi:ABC-type nitrate/sulfonate/bicarbonate transport system substrate-binding protein
VNTIATTPTAVVGLGKRNFSSIVSRDFSRLDELKGHKIGFSAGSSSHLVLMRGLKGANMTEKDVTLVPLEPAAMPDALDKGEVDAYSAWEPTPSISLARSPKNRAIYRGMSTDWVVFSREFVERDANVTQMLVAAYVRALNWMRKSKENLDRAGAWVLAESEKFNGEPAKVTAAKAIEIARKDLLEVPGAPSIPTLVDGAPPLSREFAFLKEQGRIPPAVDESVIHEAFAFDGLRKVQGDPKKYRLFTFDYEK